MNKNQTLIKRMVMISILTALSLVLYILGPKFSLPFFPAFLEINFSMLPIFIGLFLMGPIDAFVIVLLRFLIKLPFSHTVYVGEITDFILGTFVVSGTFLGKILFKKDRYVFLCAFISWIIGGVIANSFALPGYIYIAGFPKEAIIGMMPDYMKADANNYIWKYFILAIVPFNALISACVIAVTWPVHHRLKALYDSIGIRKDNQANNTIE